MITIRRRKLFFISVLSKRDGNEINSVSKRKYFEICCPLYPNPLKFHSFVRFLVFQPQNLYYGTNECVYTLVFSSHNSIRLRGWNINCTSCYHHQCIEFVVVFFLYFGLFVCALANLSLRIFFYISISIGSECMHVLLHALMQYRNTNSVVCHTFKW